MEELKKQFRDCLENNILKYWIDKVTDNERGGYYGRVDGHDKVHPEAEKEPFSMPAFCGPSQQHTAY